MPAYDYDCPAIANGFIMETGRYVNEVAMKSIPYTPWLANTPRGEWQDGMGQIHNSIIWERTVPGDLGTEWTDTVSSDGASNQACRPEAELLTFGQTTRSMQRQQRYIQTDDFCLEDLKNDFQIETFLRGVGRNLSGVSKYVWATRRRREYARLAEHHLTERPALYLDATTEDPLLPPTSRLTQGTLDQIYDYLFLNGAFGEGASIGTTATGSSVATLITDSNTSQDLINQNPDRREDFRYAFMGMGTNSPLISAYGMARSYGNFKHVIDYPQRFNIVNNAYVEVLPYLTPTATTKGYKQEVNPAYRYATYQRSVIHIPSVYRELVPRPTSNPGGKFQFNPQNYMGEFSFKVIVDKKCNPRGNQGFFDALFMSASEPGETWQGFTVMHLNCLPIRKLKNCNDYS